MTHGSQAHKTLFCKDFIDTHRAFEPEDLPWPEIDAVSIDRLRSIPFWGVALASERNAGRMVAEFAATVEDPLLREALAMQGVEEARHARILSVMLDHYGVEVPFTDVKPRPATERNFMDFGYEECIDSFFGFGIFGLARQIQLFIPELTDIFEYVLLEEARHVTFFVNWAAYERIRRGRGWMPLQAASAALGYARALYIIATTFAPSAPKPGKKPADGSTTPGVGFAVEGAFAMFEDVTWRSFLRACVDGNAHYMKPMPAGLLTPTFLPNIAKAALKLPGLDLIKRRNSSPLAA